MNIAARLIVKRTRAFVQRESPRERKEVIPEEKPISNALLSLPFPGTTKEI
jgi:hypothetical protein